MDKGEILDGVVTTGACEINGLNRAKEKVKEKINKKLLAMTIDSDTNDGGLSQGSISRSYECVGKNPTVYPFCERLLRVARWGNRLSFQRLGGERAGFA